MTDFGKNQQMPASQNASTNEYATDQWQLLPDANSGSIAPPFVYSYQDERGLTASLHAVTLPDYPWSFDSALCPPAIDLGDAAGEGFGTEFTEGEIDHIGALEPVSYFTDAIINSIAETQESLSSAMPISWGPESPVNLSPPAEDTKISSSAENIKVDSPPSDVIISPKRTTKPRNSPDDLTGSSRQSAGITKTKASRRKSIEPSFRACWRCKRYRKPCDHNTVCNGCLMTSGFRIWPSALGCRRGDLHEFAYLIIPVTTSDTLKQMDFEYVKPFSWRLAPLTSQQQLGLVRTNRGGDIWNKIIDRMRSTFIHGPGILELLEICARFQRQQLKPNAALREAAIGLHLVVELYHSLVSTTAPETFAPSINIEEKFLNVRKALMQTMDRYVHACLTGKMKMWPPLLLACSLFVITYVYLADAVAALPWIARTGEWKDVKSMVLNLRDGLYTIARDLLSALAKGVKMLDMDCWVYEDTPENSKEPTRRNAQGMRLMDDDNSAFDTMAELVEWRSKFLNLLDGDIWLSTTPFDVDLLPIMSLARLFNVSTKVLEKESES